MLGSDSACKCIESRADSNSSNQYSNAHFKREKTLSAALERRQNTDKQQERQLLCDI